MKLPSSTMGFLGVAAFAAAMAWAVGIWLMQSGADAYAKREAAIRASCVERGGTIIEKHGDTVFNSGWECHGLKK